MADFLLLGQIPGTSIQITFWGWLAAFGLLLLAYLLWRSVMRHKMQLWLGLLYVNLYLDQKLLRHPTQIG